jgi:hypothetical protein
VQYLTDAFYTFQITLGIIDMCLQARVGIWLGGVAPYND